MYVIDEPSPTLLTVLFFPDSVVVVYGNGYPPRWRLPPRVGRAVAQCWRGFAGYCLGLIKPGKVSPGWIYKETATEKTTS